MLLNGLSLIFVGNYFNMSCTNDVTPSVKCKQVTFLLVQITYAKLFLFYNNLGPTLIILGSVCLVIGIIASIVYYLKNRESKCVTVASVIINNRPAEAHTENQTGAYQLPPAYQDPKPLYPVQYPISQSSPYIPVTEGYVFPVTEDKKYK